MNRTSHGTLLSYISGFVLSVMLTLTVYFLVTNHVASGHATYSHGIMILAILGLAFVQLVVQLVFFLHLGAESKPRWNLAVFMFMLVILVVIVGGSLWIMNNLNYNMKSPLETNASIMMDEGIRR